MMCSKQKDDISRADCSPQWTLEWTTKQRANQKLEMTTMGSWMSREKSLGAMLREDQPLFGSRQPPYMICYSNELINDSS